MFAACLRRLLLPAGLVLAALPACAGAIEVAPVSHDLAPGQTTLSMTVSNRADASASVQVRGFVWRQEGAQDALVPADTLLVAPAIFKLEPGRSQVLRVRVPAAAAGREATYRLWIDELPAPGAVGQVHMALRLSVPIFVRAATPMVPHAPQLSATFDPATTLITLANTGGKRARVHELTLVSGGGERLVAKPLAGPYLLAGAQRPWSLAVSPPWRPQPGSTSLIALTDDGPVEVPLVAAR